MGRYGKVLDVNKGLISPKKLPGCTNGIWSVKIILEKDQTLPPFLIMKEEGEVWQLAIGEISVCWKCGAHGHIGDKCYQDVSALAASLVGPSVSQQPSWAHVVRGARADHPNPQFPLPPPLPMLPPPGKLCVQITAGAIQFAKSRLVVVGEGRFDVEFSGVNPEFRDEYMRELLDKMAKAAQQVEDAEVANDTAVADIFVAGEIIAVADQSQVDESQVLVQPADALYSEVGHGDGIAESHDKVIVSETSVNVSSVK